MPRGLFGLLAPLPAEMQQASEIVDRQLDRLTRLVDDLFDVSRITRGKLELHVQRVPLTELVQRAVEMSRPLIEASRHKRSSSRRRQRPWSWTPIRRPSRRSSQISPRTTVRSTWTSESGITLSTRRDGCVAVIAVSDTGIGIPQEMLGRIFEPFMQADISVERRQGGLGIGLTLAQRLVQLHGAPDPRLQRRSRLR